MVDRIDVGVGKGNICGMEVLISVVFVFLVTVLPLVFGVWFLIKNYKHIKADDIYDPPDD